MGYSQSVSQPRTAEEPSTERSILLLSHSVSSHDKYNSRSLHLLCLCVSCIILFLNFSLFMHLNWTAPWNFSMNLPTLNHLFTLRVLIVIATTPIPLEHNVGCVLLIFSSQQQQQQQWVHFIRSTALQVQQQPHDKNRHTDRCRQLNTTPEQAARA